MPAEPDGAQTAAGDPETALSSCPGRTGACHDVSGQPFAQRVFGPRRHGVQAELAHDVLAVHFHRRRGDAQLGGDARRAVALGDAVQHLALARAQPLLKYARHCGVGTSMAALTKRGISMLKLVGAIAPSEIVIGLARARLDDPPNRIERCHFFPVGRFHATAAWAAALAAASFTIGRNGRADGALID